MEDELKVEEQVYLSYARTRLTDDLLAEHISSGVVLDIGSGRGHTMIKMENLGADFVLGCDIFTDPLISERIKSKNVSFIEADCTALPLSDEKVSLVYAHHVIEHIPDVDSAITELYRVLSQSGSVIICVPTISSKTFYLYRLGGLLLLKCFSYFKSKKNEKHSVIHGINRPGLVLGEKAEGSIFVLEQVLSKIPIKYLQKIIFNWATILYFSIQNHIEHRHQLFKFQWEQIFREKGFNIFKVKVCSIFPHWITAFLPVKMYNSLIKIERKLNNIGFIQNMLSQDLFFILRK